MDSYLNMAQKKYNAFDHASHNLKAHNYIKEHGNLHDWEITTAFYCSLKFFEGSLFPHECLFPGKEHEKEKQTRSFETYNEYKSFFSRFCQGTPHDSMKRFVKYNTTQEIWSSYNDLYDLSHNSRYKNYIIEEKELSMARESLEVIRAFCIKHQR